MQIEIDFFGYKQWPEWRDGVEPLEVVQVKMARNPPFLVPHSDGNRSPRLPNGSIQDLTQLFERPNEGRNQESILEIE